MKNTDFLDAMGNVNPRYVEEMMQATEHGAVTRHIRFDPAAVFGVLGGAAVCAAMVFGILAVKQPAANVTTAGNSDTVQYTAETISWNPDTFIDPNAANLYDFKFVEGSVTATGLQLDITNLTDDTTQYFESWWVETSAGERISDGYSVTRADSDSMTDGMSVGETWRANIGWSKDGNPLELDPGSYNLVYFASDETGVAMTPADKKYTPFTYGTDFIEVRRENKCDVSIPAETVTNKGLKLNITLPEESDDDYTFTWSLWKKQSERNALIVTKGLVSESPFTISGSAGTQSVDISWQDNKQSQNPTEIEAGVYCLYVTVFSTDPEKSYSAPVYQGTVPFKYGDPYTMQNLETHEDGASTYYDILYDIPAGSVTDSGLTFRMKYLGNETDTNYQFQYAVQNPDGNLPFPYQTFDVSLVKGEWVEYNLDWSALTKLTKTGDYELSFVSTKFNSHTSGAYPFRYVHPGDPNNSATNIYDFKVVEGSVTATGLQLDITRLAENTTGHLVTWRLENSQGQMIADSIWVNGIANADSTTGMTPVGEMCRAEISWNKNGEPLELEPGIYNLVFYATDENGDAVIPADAQYVSFTYGNPVEVSAENECDITIPEESVTKDGLTLNITLPETTDENYMLLWSLYTHFGLNADENRFLTKNLTSESPIIIPAGSLGPQSIDISWLDYKQSLYPTEIEKGVYLLSVTVLNTNPAASNSEPIYQGGIQFNFGVDGPIELTTPAVPLMTTTTGNDFLIHFPNDPYDPDSTTTTTTAVTAPAEYNDGKVRIIAEFREQMGKSPARLTDDETARIAKLFDAMTLVRMTNSYANAYLDQFTGGGYVIYLNGKRSVLYDESCIRTGDTCYAITDGGKALVDEVIAMVTKYQP